jgi:mono/diheme cytochrome c family protein
MTWFPLRLLLAGPAAVALISTATADEPRSGQGGAKVDFARDVRPILASSCYACHGPEKQKAGLRLDRKREALAGGDSGKVVVPGKPDESPLIERVTSDDPTTAMPPKGERLSPGQVNILRAWVDQGASWPDGLDGASGSAAKTHWAFQPPTRPTPPAVKARAWVRNPIDAFVLARLESLGVAPSPEADRATLVRRLSLDLTGLPPTPAEVVAFVDDRSEGAYEAMVDRLLASPHFGERWGRHWLDLARYADSDGYEKDSPRPFAWRYRDWVIDANNRDLPFDRFTVEQLAGDLLPGASLDQKIATGFHRNTLTNREGGTDPEEFRVAAVVDRVNTTGTVWLGLTVGCAQCHTHKYDPLLHKEYYGLFAFFNNGDEVDLPAPLSGEAEAYARAKAAFDAEHTPLREALEAYDRDRRPAHQAEWEKSATVPSARWSVLEPIKVNSAAGVSLTVKSDRSILASGINPDADTYTIVVRSDLAGITAFRLEVLDDPTLPARGPGRVAHGNFVLNDLRVTETPRGGEGAIAAELVPLANATADYSQDGYSVAGAIDDDPKTGWAIAGQLGRRHVAVFETKGGVGSPTGATFTFTLDQRYGQQHTLGRFRLSATTAARPVRADDMPDDVAEILALSPDRRTAPQKARLAAYHRTVDPEWTRLDRAVAEHAKKAPKPPTSKAQTLAQAANPRKTHIHIRGDFLRKGDEVSPDTPAVLHPLKASGSTPNRLDLAHWLTDPANPLTARVTVNRMWGHLFGRPLVVSVEDFGTRGEKPSHPELLDWLATELPARGWSRKAMIKLIVTSATYRQSSRVRPDLVDRDPNNTWLARQGRFRPEAEVIRDLTLAASGLLNPAVGGPSVRPPQPPGISDLTYAGSAKWVESTGPDRYRRGMYTWFQRTSPYPMLMTFDAPDSNVCAARRERSNTPLQALTLLNDAVFVECAQSLGRRILAESPCDCPEGRIRHAFLLCLAREPSTEELPVLTRLHDGLLASCRAHPDEAARLAGPTKPAGVQTAEAAAWVAMGRAMLNLDEFVTRE